METQSDQNARPFFFSALPWTIIIVSWIVFCCALALLCLQHKGLGGSFGKMVALAAIVMQSVAIPAALWKIRARWAPGISRILSEHTQSVDSLMSKNTGVWIMLAAGLGLFCELMIIRLHASYFQLFAYFKNVSLLSCFLGLGIGYMFGNKKPLSTPLFPFLVAAQAFPLFILRQGKAGFYLQNPIAEQFGMGIRQAQALGAVLCAYGFIVCFFTLNVLCFVPLGHLAAYAMSKRPALSAYSWNLGGSLIGIALFTFLSFICSPPPVWIAAAGAAASLFFIANPKALAACLAVFGAVALFIGLPWDASRQDLYSPYQILTVVKKPDRLPEIKVNNVYYQEIVDLSGLTAAHGGDKSDNALHYNLPYYFIPTQSDVLVVGSGSGNDVAAAVRNRMRTIDAVEIDPLIISLGKIFHPENPYNAAQVRTIVNDARAHLRHTQRHYDAIIYGLLDSHTLLSGMSSVRLDSYVYTVGAFREARARLTDKGILCVSFSLIGQDMGRKMFLMLKEAFNGRDPMVFRTGHDGGYAFVIGNAPMEPVSPLPAALIHVTQTFATPGAKVDLSTDDWPFLYMPRRTYPFSYVVMISLLLSLSVLLIRGAMPRNAHLFSAPSFFLGAGFMLVETKAITELALLFGSTWIVISVVIGVVLLFGFAGNALIMRMKTLRPNIGYSLLLLSIVAGMFAPSVQDIKVDTSVISIATALLINLPLFFSGMLFSVQMKELGAPSRALSSNLLGAMAGGFLEYNSLYFGFRSLYFFAMALYACAYVSTIVTARSARV